MIDSPCSSSKEDINNIPEKISTAGEDVRTRLLAALLRLADALDCREDRLPPEDYRIVSIHLFQVNLLRIYSFPAVKKSLFWIFIVPITLIMMSRFLAPSVVLKHPHIPS